MFHRLRWLLYKVFIEKKLNDPFISRLRCAVAGEGMVNNGNVFAFDHAIRHLPDHTGSIVEIGSFGGMSTNIIAYLLAKHGRGNPFFTCDPWVYEGFEGESETHVGNHHRITRSDYRNFVKQSFLNSTRFFSADRLPHTFECFSDQFFELWNLKAADTDVFGNEARLGGPIVFAYIDGDHSYRATQNDFDNIYRHLSKGGFVLLDDSAAYLSFGSARFAKEVTRRYSDMKVVFQGGNYLFQRS